MPSSWREHIARPTSTAIDAHRRGRDIIAVENLHQRATEMKQTVNNKVEYFRYTNEAIEQTQFTMGRFRFWI